MAKKEQKAFYLCNMFHPSGERSSAQLQTKNPSPIQLFRAPLLREDDAALRRDKFGALLPAGFFPELPRPILFPFTHKTFLRSELREVAKCEKFP